MGDSRVGDSRGVRSIVRIFWGLGLVPLLSACMLHVEKPELALAIPHRYRDATTTSRAALPKTDWWRAFRSPELTKLIGKAQVGNLDIAAAVARIIQADAQARIAGAALLPSIDFGASASHSRASKATGTVLGGGGGPSEHDEFGALFNASYELDFWGKNRASLRAAEENAAASRFDRETVALTALAAVADTYFEVLAAQDRLHYARDNLNSAESVLKVIQQRLNVGTGTALDVAQQQSVVNTERAAIPPLEQTLRQSIATLAVLLGRAPEFLHVRGGSMFKIAIPRITPGLPTDLLMRRPDIRQAEANLAADGANVYAARAAFFPDLTLSADGGWQASAIKWLARPEAATYQIAANLAQPIFDGGQLQGQLDLQKGLQEEQLQTYRKTVLQAFADVDSALTAVQQQTIRERLQNDVVASSRRAFQLAEQQLQAGIVDITSVLNTQQTLFQAQDTLAQVRLARLQAIVGLFQALGGGWIAESGHPYTAHQ